MSRALPQRLRRLRGTSRGRWPCLELCDLLRVDEYALEVLLSFRAWISTITPPFSARKSYSGIRYSGRFRSFSARGHHLELCNARSLHGRICIAHLSSFAINSPVFSRDVKNMISTSDFVKRNHRFGACDNPSCVLFFLTHPYLDTRGTVVPPTIRVVRLDIDMLSSSAVRFSPTLLYRYSNPPFSSGGAW